MNLTITITPEIYQKAKNNTAGNGKLNAYYEFVKTNANITYRAFCYAIQKKFIDEQMTNLRQKLEAQSQATQLPCGCSCNCGRLLSKQND